MYKTTKSLHTKVDTQLAHPTVTPLYQNSAFESQSEFFYSRKNNPNVQEFEEAVCVLEESKYGIATTTGMSAINLSLSLLKPGQTIVLNKYIYGCTFKLFQWYASHYGLKLIVEDLSQLSEIVHYADFVFFETPTNPFLFSVDIKHVAASYKKLNSKCVIVVDNTSKRLAAKLGFTIESQYDTYFDGSRQYMYWIDGADKYVDAGVVEYSCHYSWYDVLDSLQAIEAHKP